MKTLGIFYSSKNLLWTFLPWQVTWDCQFPSSSHNIGPGGSRLYPCLHSTVTELPTSSSYVPLTEFGISSCGHEHAPESQLSVSLLELGQSLPPCLGLGFVQVLVLVFVPIPQFDEQPLQGPQTDHWPCTGRSSLANLQYSWQFALHHNGNNYHINYLKFLNCTRILIYECIRNALLKVMRCTKLYSIM